jgi:hypothetical protein
LIVGGYTLDLYCDGPRHRELHPVRTRSCDASIGGPTRRDCETQARNMGWKLKDDKCFCKRCRQAEREATNG